MSLAAQALALFLECTVNPIYRIIITACVCLSPSLAAAELYVVTLSGLAADPYPLPVQPIFTRPTLIFQGVGDISQIQTNIGASILPLRSVTEALQFRSGSLSEIVGPFELCTGSRQCTLTTLSTADPTFLLTDLIRITVPHDTFFAAPNLPYDFTLPSTAVSIQPPLFLSTPGTTVHFTLAPIPEPSTLALGLSALAGAIFSRQRGGNRQAKRRRLSARTP